MQLPYLSYVGYFFIVFLVLNQYISQFTYNKKSLQTLLQKFLKTMYEEYQTNKNHMKQQDQQEDQLLPQYGQVEGQKIYMRGLDYSLLQKQKQQDAKLGLLSNIKSQLFNIQSKVDSRTVKSTSQKPLDEESIKLITSIKNLQNVKPLVNSSTYYVFDARYNFGKLHPQVITKRLGRMNKEAAYIRLNPETMAKFNNILQKPQIDLDRLNKDKAFSKLINGEGEDSNSDSSDNIFGSDSEEQKGQSQTKTKLFNFGQKLSFGVKDQEIFNTKNHSEKSPIELDEIQSPKNPSQQKDKYEFMRKKVKKTINPNEDQDDGYGQCYFQSGPSFEQMKEYREQGIEIFGDLKEAPKKGQRKTNIHRQYDMVKRIIDEKSKKK